MGAEGPAWPEDGWVYGRRWMRSGDLGARLRWDAGRTGPSPPFLAPPIRMDAKTFSYFIFYWCFFFFLNDVSKAIPSFCEIQAR